MLGYDTTVRVSMEEMLHHTKAVVRGTKRALVVADMPFLTYSNVEDAIANAGRFMREAGAQAVKLEGGVRSARMIEALVRAGIPVMGHIGLTPQAINTLGKVRVQGKSRDQARQLLADALAVQEAGAFAIVLELVPEQLAAAITERLRIPTIGIGAGAGCSRADPGHQRHPGLRGLDAEARAAGTRTCGERSSARSRSTGPTSRRARSRARPRPCGWTSPSWTRSSGGPSSDRAAPEPLAGIPLDRDL